jgi:hypothetical protein
MIGRLAGDGFVTVLVARLKPVHLDEAGSLRSG